MNTKMSIYNTLYKNSIDLRGNNGTFETLKVWDPALEQYVPVTGSGGEPVTLPYYAKTNRVEFQQDTTKATLNQHGLVFNYGEQQESVNFESIRNQQFVIDAHEASLEELDGRLNTVENTILPAHEASLEELDGRVLGNTNSLATLTTRVTNTETVNTTQGTNIAALQTKTANITQTASTSNCFGYASTSTPRALINSAGLHVYNATSTTTPSYPHAKIEPTSITLATSSTGSVYLDVTRIDNLAKLTSVTTSDFNDKLNLTKGVTFPGAVETLDTSNKKMIVMDNTTKALSYATIPTGGGGSSVVMYYKPQNVTEGAVGYGEVTRSGEVYALKSGTLTSSNSLYRYNYANHYLFDLADKPFSMSELTVSSGILYAFFIDGLTDNHRLTIDYFRSANDEATVTEITTGVINVPFFSTIVPKKMALVHIFHSSLTGTNSRYLRGKVLINIYDDANNQTAVPTVVVATG